MIDVRDPKNPKMVKYVAAPHNTWSLHLQTHEDLLLVINNKDMFAQPDLADEKAYYRARSTSMRIRKRRNATGRRGSPSTISQSPTIPKRIGFMPVDGTGLHRLWYVGALGLRLGADRRLLRLHPHHHRHGRPDPSRGSPANTWLPGMNVAAGETPNWPTPNGRFGLHHAIIHEDIAYCSWRDACLAVVDVKDRANPG